MFAENLDKRNIVLIEKAEKEHILKKLCSLVYESGNVDSLENLEEKIFHRESLMSTGIGLGIAIPHVRYEGVKAINIAIAVSKTPIARYDSIDGKPIRIVIMIVVPEKNHRQHIQILSDIVKTMKNDNTKEKILAATTADEIYTLLH